MRVNGTSLDQCAFKAYRWLENHERVDPDQRPSNSMLNRMNLPLITLCEESRHVSLQWTLSRQSTLTKKASKIA